MTSGQNANLIFLIKKIKIRHPEHSLPAPTYPHTSDNILFLLELLTPLNKDVICVSPLTTNFGNFALVARSFVFNLSSSVLPLSFVSCSSFLRIWNFISPISFSSFYCFFILNSSSYFHFCSFCCDQLILFLSVIHPTFSWFPHNCSALFLAVIPT